MVTCFSILAWEIQWTENPGGLQSTGLQESDLTYPLNNHIYNCINICIYINWGFPGGSVLKESACPMQETQDRSLGREDPLEKEMATHSSILAWRIPWTEEPVMLIGILEKIIKLLRSHSWTSFLLSFFSSFPLYPFSSFLPSFLPLLFAFNLYWPKNKTPIFRK